MEWSSSHCVISARLERRTLPPFCVARCLLGNLDHGEPELPVMRWAVAKLRVPDKVVFRFPRPFPGPQPVNPPDAAVLCTIRREASPAVATQA